MTPLVDLDSEEFRCDPVAYLLQFLPYGATWTTAGMPIVLDHATARSVLRSPSFGRQRSQEQWSERFPDGPMRRVFSRAMNFLDPPHQRTQRRLVLASMCKNAGGGVAIWDRGGRGRDCWQARRRRRNSTSSPTLRARSRW